MKASVYGGVLAGKYDDVNDLVAKAQELGMSIGKMADMSEERNKGMLVYRAELDNQPKIFGYYIGPMWDGDCLRYESPEVYAMFSD